MVKSKIDIKLRSPEQIHKRYIQISEIIDQNLREGRGDVAVNLYPAKLILEWVLNIRDVKIEPTKAKK